MVAVIIGLCVGGFFYGKNYLHDKQEEEFRLYASVITETSIAAEIYRHKPDSFIIVRDSILNKYGLSLDDMDTYKEEFPGDHRDWARFWGIVSNLTDTLVAERIEMLRASGDTLPIAMPSQNSTATVEHIDARWDINLNGIPHDPDDLEIMKDWVFAGKRTKPPVRTDPLQTPEIIFDPDQKITIDNLQDFIAAVRKDRGEPDKIADSISGIVMAIPNDKMLLLTYSFDYPVGSFLLRFKTPDSTLRIELSGPYSEYNIDKRFDSNILSVLIYSFQPDSKVALTSGPLMNIWHSGDIPELLSVTASGYYGEPVNIRVTKRTP